MSIYFTRFPISGLGKPKLYQNMWCFTRMGDFTWREFVGVINIYTLQGNHYVDGVGTHHPL